MSFSYTYSQTSNFPGGLNSSQLVSNINSWPVVGATCLFVNTYGDDVYVNMNVNLSITQKNQLDAAIAAYIYKSNDIFNVTTTGIFGTQTILNTTQTVNRTINLPDADDTIVCRATADTLTNKTIIDQTDNVIARGLWNASGGSSVSTYLSSAPTAGQILKATSGTTATWQTLSTSDIGSGVLAVTRGGTGLSSYTVGDLLFASATTTLGSLADVATGNALISGGVGVAPSWGKIGLTTHISGTLPAANGGTGNATYVVGDLLYANSTTTLARLADVAVGSVLVSGGIGVAPSWGQININTSVSGILSVVNGGTGFGSYSPGDLLYASSASTLTRLAIAAVNNVLTTSTGNNLVWSKVDLTTTVSNTLPVANGGTGATTLTAGNILRGNGTGAITATLAAPASALVGVSDSQTLTNKTMTATANAITCRALGTTGADVQVSTAAPPTTGQALIATSATSATWQAITASALTTNYTSLTASVTVSIANTFTVIGLTFTPTAGTYMIMFSASMQYADLGGSTTSFAIFAGGSQVADSTRTIAGAHSPLTTVQIDIFTMTRQILNGATAIDVRVNPGTNTATLFGRNLFAFRIA